jgi:hypothetical protein
LGRRAEARLSTPRLTLSISPESASSTSWKDRLAQQTCCGGVRQRV